VITIYRLPKLWIIAIETCCAQECRAERIQPWFLLLVFIYLSNVLGSQGPRLCIIVSFVLLESWNEITHCMPGNKVTEARRFYDILILEWYGMNGSIWQWLTSKLCSFIFSFHQISSSCLHTTIFLLFLFWGWVCRVLYGLSVDICVLSRVLLLWWDKFIVIKRPSNAPNLFLMLYQQFVLPNDLV
jgi:hypothetical protein